MYGELIGTCMMNNLQVDDDDYGIYLEIWHKLSSCFTIDLDTWYTCLHVRMTSWLNSNLGINVTQKLAFQSQDFQSRLYDLLIYSQLYCPDKCMGWKPFTTLCQHQAEKYVCTYCWLGFYQKLQFYMQRGKCIGS